MPDPTYDLAALAELRETYAFALAVVGAAQFLPEFLASNHCPECWHEGYAVGHHKPNGCPFGALVAALAPFTKEPPQDDGDYNDDLRGSVMG